MIVSGLEKGSYMKNKKKSDSIAARDQGRIGVEHERKWKGWRQIRLQLAAIFLIIVFLASECATLLPVE